MTGADLGHRVCLAEIGSAAASYIMFASALPSGPGLSLGPKATLTLERSGSFAGRCEWECRRARLTGHLVWDGFTMGRTGDALKSKLLTPTSQPGNLVWYWQTMASTAPKKLRSGLRSPNFMSTNETNVNSKLFDPRVCLLSWLYSLPQSK